MQIYKNASPGVVYRSLTDTCHIETCVEGEVLDASRTLLCPGNSCDTAGTGRI